MAEFVAFITNSLTITVLVAYLFALWGAMVAWTWFDIAARTDNYFYRLGAVLIVATGALLGFAIYLLLRPTLTKEDLTMKEAEEAILASQMGVLSCPNCHSFVKESFSFCTHCSSKLQSECQNCRKAISVSWSSCPFCGTKSRAVEDVKRIVDEEPAFMPSAVQVRNKFSAPALFSSIIGYLNRRQDVRQKKSKINKKTTPAAAKIKKASVSPKRKKA